MKKLILTLITACAVVSTYGQGFVAWSSSGLPTASVAGNQIMIKATDGSTSLMPVRSSTANTYVIAIFLADSEAGLATANPFAYSSNSATAGKDGLYGGGNLSLPLTATYFQVRAWSWNAGLNWNDAKARIDAGDGTVWFGQSTVGQATPLAPPNSPPNIWTTASVPIDGFTLSQVPEPSTIALIGLGLAGLIFIRRRK